MKKDTVVITENAIKFNTAEIAPDDFNLIMKKVNNLMTDLLKPYGLKIDYFEMDFHDLEEFADHTRLNFDVDNRVYQD